MNALRRHHRTRVMFLLAALLLAAQTLLLWHTHGGKLTPDEHCELCLHAQHHTPALVTIQAPMLALFTQVAVAQPLNTDTFHLVYQITIPSRAPPASFLT